MTSSFDTASQAFHDHYYNTFDQNRQALAGLYQQDAILSFEGAKVQGQAAIMQKLTSLPFQQAIILVHGKSGKLGMLLYAQNSAA
jgi:hypothetical protein